MSALTSIVAQQRLGLEPRAEPYAAEEVDIAFMCQRERVDAADLLGLSEAARFLKKPMQIRRPLVAAARGAVRLAKKRKQSTGVEPKRKAARRRPTKPSEQAMAPPAAFAIQSTVRVTGINAAPSEFVMQGHRYPSRPRLLVAINYGDTRIVDLFRNTCRWHPDDVPTQLRGTFKTPNHAGEVLLQTLKPCERTSNTRRTASARQCFFIDGRSARTLIASDAAIADHLDAHASGFS